MSKRRTREQIDADKIIKQHLNDLGEVIYQQAIETSRRDEGRLQDEQNYRVQPDTVLTFAQVKYGKWNYPKGNNTKRTYTSDGKVVVTEGMNALLIAINDNLEDATAIIIESITDQILKDFI
jgi:hypothetical protein